MHSSKNAPIIIDTTNLFIVYRISIIMTLAPSAKPRYMNSLQQSKNGDIKASPCVMFLLWELLKFAEFLGKSIKYCC